MQRLCTPVVSRAPFLYEYFFIASANASQVGKYAQDHNLLLLSKILLLIVRKKEPSYVWE